MRIEILASNDAHKQYLLAAAAALVFGYALAQCLHFALQDYAINIRSVDIYNSLSPSAADYLLTIGAPKLKTTQLERDHPVAQLDDVHQTIQIIAGCK